jgi:hypothetical protein
MEIIGPLVVLAVVWLLVDSFRPDAIEDRLRSGT